MSALSDEKKRWCAALLISFAIHGALIFALNGAQKKEEKRPEPVMNVRLVFAPEPPLRKSGGAPKAETNAKAAPQPKKAEIKKQPRAEALKKSVKAAPVKEIKEISDKPAESVEESAPTTEGYSGAQESGAAESSAAGAGGAGSGGFGGGTGYGSGGVADVSALTVIHKVIPDYPAFSRKRREEGTVTIIASLADGAVTAAEVEKGSGFARLDMAALRAVKGWRFAHDGKIRVRIPFAFKIK